MMGNSDKVGTAAVAPIKYIRFTPKRPTIREKKNMLKTPIPIPMKDMMVPITGGSIPRPPNAMGVARNTGCRVRKEISTSAMNV